MNNSVFKYIKWFSYVLMVLGVATFAYFLVMMAVRPEPSIEFPSSVGAAMSVNYMIFYAEILVGVAILAALIFPVIQIFTNPKAAFRSLIGVCGIAIMLVISYFFASDAPVANSAGGFFEGKFWLITTDMMLYVTYAITLIAFLLILAGELRKSFK